MNIFKAGWWLIGIISSIIICSILFAVLIPMNFYVSSRGRLEPTGKLSITFQETGKLISIYSKENFKRGEVLAALDIDPEKLKLQSLTREHRLISRELLEQEKSFAAAREKYLLDRKTCKLMLDQISLEIPMQKQQIQVFDSISKNLTTQKKLDENLKKEEAAIFKSLYERKLVAKLEFLKVMHDKKMAESMSEQVKVQMEEKLYDYKIELEKLNWSKKTKGDELNFLQHPFPPDLRKTQVELQLERIHAELNLLKEKIKRKTFVAPFDGTVLRRTKIKESLINSGDLVLEIAANSKMRFLSVVDQSVRSDLKKGQKAEIYLDNYPFQTFGFYISGELVDIQTNLSGAVSYPLTISMEVPFEKYPPGLSGEAKIIVFHGTLVNYLFRDINP